MSSCATRSWTRLTTSTPAASPITRTSSGQRWAAELSATSCSSLSTTKACASARRSRPPRCTDAGAEGRGLLSQLDLTSPTGTLDCNGAPTYQGELFDTTLTQATTANSAGFCGVPFGYANGAPSNVIPAISRLILWARRLSIYFPPPMRTASVTTTSPTRCSPKL